MLIDHSSSSHNWIVFYVMSSTNLVFKDKFLLCDHRHPPYHIVTRTDTECCRFFLAWPVFCIKNSDWDERESIITNILNCFLTRQHNINFPFIDPTPITHPSAIYAWNYHISMGKNIHTLTYNRSSFSSFPFSVVVGIDIWQHLMKNSVPFHKLTIVKY